MQSHFATALLLALGALPAQAQRQRCGTPEPTPFPAGARADATDCGYLTNTPQPEYEPTCTYHIQVVFHVMQHTSGDGFLDPVTIQDQIDILNEDLQAIPGTPGAPGTNAKIQFHLATIDPDGNPTTGITYSTNNNWYFDSGNYWGPLAWDTNRYMNIYTNAVPCCYGYVSDFPSQGIAGQTDDRIVLWWEAVGRNPTAGWPLNMGRTATHEVGHYLGLYHTFCGGCGSDAACYSTGDLICDTNGEANSTSGCPGSKSSCGSPDPFHNYMDYTDDPCIWEFTPEQVNRMRCTLINWRSDVYETSSAAIGASFCTSLPNSSGSSATISASGDASIAANDLTLNTAGGALGTPGLFFYGENQIQAPFGDGLRCAGGMTYRLFPPLFSNGSGSATRPLDFSQPPLSGGTGVLPGSTWNFQFWFRDSMGPGGSGFNLTDGVSLTFCE